MERLTVHGYDWTITDKYTEDDRTAIHAWCLDRESNPYLIRFDDFPVFCHVELPLFVNGQYMRWTEHTAGRFVSWLNVVLGEDRPERGMFKEAKKIYFYRGEKMFPMLLLLFKSMSAMNHCEALLTKPHRIPDIGLVMARVWETSISVVRKLLTLRETRYSQWFTIDATKVPSEDRISTLEREYIGHWKTLTAIPSTETKGWTTHPRVLSFDIECYSSNHKAMPNQLHALHVAYMISIIFQRSGDPSSRKRYGIILGDCDDVTVDATRPGPFPKEPNQPRPDEQVPGDLHIEIIRVKTEIEMINKMSELVNHLDPEILIGYNILAFDYPYLDARLKRRLQEWQPMGRIVNKPSIMTSKTWKSGAYGHNSVNILHMDGRISIDMLPLIKRDFKYDKYDLDFTSKEILGAHRGKHDVKADVQFRIYEELVNAKANVTTKLDSIHTKESNSKTQLKSAFDISIEETKRVLHSFTDITGGSVEELVLALDRYHQAKTEMTRVMKYCLEDSELVLDMFEKMNIWIGLVELSNIVGVTISELFTRGQQVRCLSQVYDLAARNNFVIDSRENEGIRFSGGFVFEPKPGLYENIICLDFASLYPSIMQAFNICFTTLVPPELMDSVPDDQTHVFDFDQEEDDDEDDEDDDPDVAKKKRKEKKKGKKNEKKKIVHRHYKFVKPSVRLGILPQLVRNLVAERRAVRQLLDGVKDEKTGEWIIKKETDPMIRTILDKRQLALKVTANSFFGFLGVQNGGKLPLIEGAMCITAKGRSLISSVNGYLEKTRGGTIVYGDTDSSMVNLHITDPKDCNPIGEALSKEITAFINHPPLKMEFEKGMRHFLVLKKKMYMYTLTDSDGNEKRKDGQVIVIKKGVAEARRDRCKWFRKVSDRISRMILGKAPMHETLNVLVDMVSELLRGAIPIRELVSIRELGAHYKSENYFVKVFADNLRKLGKIVSPGDRLEFVVVQSQDPNAKVGTKMRSPEVYSERLGTPAEERIDYIYYLEHVLMNPIDKLFSVGYNRELESIKTTVGYKPKGRYHFKSIENPIKMMIRVLADGNDISGIKGLLRPTMPPVQMKARLLVMEEKKVPKLVIV